MPNIKKSKKLFFGKTLLIAFASTLLITVLIVCFTGLSSHRTILENSIISLTILWFSFFLFVAIGLYNGFDVYDNLSHKLKFKWRGSGISGNFPETPGFFNIGGDLEGLVVSIILWIGVTIAFLLFLLFMEFFFWTTIVALIGLIYWILMRALKLIFIKSQECQNDLSKSVFYALGYTTLYVCWIYGVIYMSTMF